MLHNQSRETFELTAETGKYPDGWSKMQCHIQAVEGHIKLVSEVSMKVSGSVKKDGFVRKTFDSRKPLPKVDSKKDFRI